MLILTSDQQALRDVTREVLARACPPTQVRAAWDGPDGARLWQTLADAGMPALVVPERQGGLGLGLLDAVIVLEEVGSAAAPVALLETLLATRVIAAMPSPQHDEWLAGIAAGATRASYQLSPGAPLLDVDEAAVAVLDDGDGLVVAARSDLDLEPVGSIDGARRLARPIGPLPGMRVPPAVAAVARRAARAALGAVLVGLSQQLLDRTVEHARQREQFGRPIGSFQAVKHRLATSSAQCRAARTAVWTAAWAVDHDDDEADATAATAHWAALRAADEASDVALQIHGGIGFTWEHDLHLWMKRVIAVGRSGPSINADLRVLAEQLPTLAHSHQ